jgi:hypothetical protein
LTTARLSITISFNELLNLARTRFATLRMSDQTERAFILWSKEEPRTCPHLRLEPLTMQTAAPVSEPRVVPEAPPQAEIPDNVSTAGDDEEEEEDPLTMSPATLRALRKTTKRKHTTLTKRIIVLIESKGSRRELRRLETEMLSLMQECLRYNDALLQVARLTEPQYQKGRLWSLDLDHATKEVVARIAAYIDSRKDDASSIASTTASVRAARAQE